MTEHLRTTFCRETDFQETTFGRIPREWECVSISQISEVHRGASPRPIGSPEYFSDKGRGWVRISDVTETYKYLRRTSQYLSELGESKSVRVDHGDLIMSICATIGRPIIVDMKACIHDGFVVFRNLSSKVNTEFLFYVLQKYEQTFSSMRQTGTQGNLNTGLVGRTQISLPSLDEQQGIVEVLSCVDIAIQKTDEVIVKTERLKKGLMQKLLTEGIGHKEFKDTPIGIVPTVWEIVRLGDVATELGSGLTPLGGSRTYLEHGIPLIRSQNVQMNRLDFADIAYISQETHRAMKRSTVFHGDLLLNITGASIGRVAVVPESIDEANVNQHVCRIRFSERMDSTFASFYLSSPKGQQQILSSQAGATRQGLNYQQAKLIQLPCPSLNEQREIVRILSTIVGKLELEQKDRRKIERIKQGLMDMLLTGKVRVRVD